MLANNIILSKEKKLKLTEDIISSAIFKKAPKSSALLRYLVKSTLDGNYLKEDIIDLEFFGEKSDFDRTNPRIRVNVYNLRKKLDTYYETEGKKIIWKLCIDKGQYSVRFEKQDLGKTKFKDVKFKHVLPYILMMTLGVALIIKTIEPSPPELWQPFFKNHKQATLIIGDFYGMQGKTITGKEGWTRDYDINSTQEYYDYIAKYPELKDVTKPARYSYMTGMGAQATHDISKLFNTYGFDFDLRFSSNTSVADLKKGNLIYVGPSRTKNKFISLFNDSNPYFELKGEELQFKGHPNFQDTNFTTHFKGEDEDFAIISKFKGPSNNECFLFFSNHDIGVKATVEYFTNEDSLNVFNDKYLSGKQNFTAIFKAHGKERTNLGLKNIIVIPF